MLTLSVLMSSVLTILNNCVRVHVHRCWLKHMQWNNEVLLLGGIIVLLTLSLLFTSQWWVLRCSD